MTKGMLKTQISVFFLSLFFSLFDLWVQSAPFCTNFLEILGLEQRVKNRLF